MILILVMTNSNFNLNPNPMLVTALTLHSCDSCEQNGFKWPQTATLSNIAFKVIAPLPMVLAFSAEFNPMLPGGFSWR